MSLTSIKLPEFKPPKGSGLEQLGRLLKSAYKSYSLAAKKQGDNKYKPLVKKYVKKESTNDNKPMLKDPLEVLKGSVQSISKSLNNALGQIVKKPETIDYQTVVKGFMPEGVLLLKPKYPANSREVMQADLDGDGYDELVATFRTGEGLRTLILKGQGKNWQKTAEIYHQAHDDINYMNAVRMTGENKLHLLIGMSGGAPENILYGYTLSDDMATRLFSREYSWVEPVMKSKNTSRLGGNQFSIWNRGQDGHYDIEVLNWDGSQLVKAKDEYYYRTRIAPYYLRKARQNPYDLKCHYRLAEALLKAGAPRDARIIADAGCRQDQDPVIKEKFISLKNEIVAKYF